MVWARELSLLGSPGDGLRLTGPAAELRRAAGGGASPTTPSLARRSQSLSINRSFKARQLIMAHATVWRGLYWFNGMDASPASTARFTSPAYTDRHGLKAPCKWRTQCEPGLLRVNELPGGS